MAQRIDLEVKWVDTAFDTIFTQLAAGRYDVVASATTITEEAAGCGSWTPGGASRRAVRARCSPRPRHGRTREFLAQVL